MTEPQAVAPLSGTTVRNGILVFASGMALAAASFIAEHLIIKAARKQ